MDRAVGADAQRGFRLAAADRLDPELDRGCAGGAGGRERDRRALGAEAVGDAVCDRSEQEEVVPGLEAPGGRGLEEVRIGHAFVLARRLGERLALRPLDFDRRHGDEQRARKVALRPRPRLGNRLLGREHGEALGQHGRAEGLDFDEVDRPGNLRPQPLGREAADGMDPRAPGGQCRPVVLAALPERGDDAHAGHRDERASLPVLQRHSLSSCRRGQADEAVPAPMPDRGHDHLRRALCDQRRGDDRPDRRLCLERMADDIAERMDRRPGRDLV